MEKEIQNIKNNIMFLRNEYLEKLCEVALSIIRSDKIEVVFAGKLSTGKTTIMNALLGTDILPTGIGTVTRSINTIFKSEEDKIEAIYGDDKREFYSLQDLAIVNQKPNLKAVNVYLKEFPFSSVIFVDTPGIDELQNLENLTLSKIPTADAIIFVLDITKGLTKKDKEFFDNYIIRFLRDKIFIVFNKLDTVKDEINEQDIEKIKKSLEGFLVFVISAKEKDKNFMEFKEQLFNYLSETSKSQIIKTRIRSIIKTIEDISNKQLSLIIENMQKTKEELENKLNDLRKRRLELDNILNDMKMKVKQNINDLLYRKIIPLIEQKRIGMINLVKQVDPDNLKGLLTIDLRNEIDSILLEVRGIIKENLEFNFSEELKLGFSSVFVSIIDIIGKVIDPLLRRFNIPDFTDIIQDLIRTLTRDIIINDLNSIFDKLRDRIVHSIENYMEDYFEELKLREYANIDSEIVSVEKSIELLAKDKEEIENEIEFYKTKIKNIQNSINNIREELENKVF